MEDNKVISSEVISSNGTGHGALAGLLAEQGISVLICGGIGGGAQSALAEAGIELCSGAQGDADAAVEAYLKGEQVSTGVNCDHHHEEGHSCGSHEDGHSCGGHEEGHSCGNNLIILYLIHLEKLSFSKVLENVSVIVCCCNFHL